MMMIKQHDFTDSAKLATALSSQIATHLALALDAKGKALLAVSGGVTPIRLFEELSSQVINWSDVTITLVDERFVPPESDRSNERLVRTHLLKNNAATAQFVGLYDLASTVENAAIAANNRICLLPRPFDVVILGMGTDGHTASFFPKSDQLEQAINPEGKAFVLPIHTENTSEPRLTLTLPIILEAKLIALHIEGMIKKRVLAHALEEGDEREIPIRAILNHTRSTVHIFWAP